MIGGRSSGVGGVPTRLAVIGALLVSLSPMSTFAMPTGPADETIAPNPSIDPPCPTGTREINRRHHKASAFDSVTVLVSNLSAPTVNEEEGSKPWEQWNTTDVQGWFESGLCVFPEMHVATDSHLPTVDQAPRNDYVVFLKACGKPASRGLQIDVDRSHGCPAGYDDKVYDLPMERIKVLVESPSVPGTCKQTEWLETYAVQDYLERGLVVFSEQSAGQDEHHRSDKVRASTHPRVGYSVLRECFKYKATSCPAGYNNWLRSGTPIASVWTLAARPRDAGQREHTEWLYTTDVQGRWERGLSVFSEENAGQDDHRRSDNRHASTHPYDNYHIFANCYKPAAQATQDSFRWP